jgi:hypothetical protein
MGLLINCCILVCTGCCPALKDCSGTRFPLFYSGFYFFYHMAASPVVCRLRAWPISWIPNKSSESCRLPVSTLLAFGRVTRNNNSRENATTCDVRDASRRATGLAASPVSPRRSSFCPWGHIVLGIGPCRAGPAQAHRASCQTGSGQESPNNFWVVPCQPEV